jgi:hypothetical protein
MELIPCALSDWASQRDFGPGCLSGLFFADVVAPPHFRHAAGRCCRCPSRCSTVDGHGQPGPDHLFGPFFFASLRPLPILGYRGRCSAAIEACGGRGMRTSARHVRAFFHLKITVRCARFPRPACSSHAETARALICGIKEARILRAGACGPQAGNPASYSSGLMSRLGPTARPLNARPRPHFAGLPSGGRRGAGCDAPRRTPLSPTAAAPTAAAPTAAAPTPQPRRA